MKKIGVFVGENGKWNFFQDIFDDLSSHYATEVFRARQYNVPLLHGRLNRWAFDQAIRSMLSHCDLAFFEWASELLVPASQLPKNSPIVTRLHSYEINVWAPKIDWNNVDRIILVSEAMQHKFVERYPEHAHKTVVVYNGVSLDRFVPPMQREHAFNIGMLCSIHPVKRIYDVVLTIHELKKMGLQPHLHVAGGRWTDGYFDDYYFAILRAIEKLDLGNDVTLHSHVHDTARWLQEIDVFVSNSYWEGQQVALLEALASGCHCLCHFWDGAEEIVPNENIYVTGTELQQKLIDYQASAPEHKSRLSQLSRAIACQKFDLEQQKQHVRRVIEEVAGNAAGRSDYRR